jgi:hypothetical protein
VAPTLPYKFANAFGSMVGVYRGCCCCVVLEVIAPATCGLDGVAAVFPALGATNGPAPVDCDELELPEVLGTMLDSVWLMLMSWSNWLSETIWPTISVGSTGEVGSWFCSSVTSRLRKVSCRLVDEVALELFEALDGLLVLVVLPVPLAALGATATLDCTGAEISGVNP